MDDFPWHNATVAWEGSSTSKPNQANLCWHHANARGEHPAHSPHSPHSPHLGGGGKKRGQKRYPRPSPQGGGAFQQEARTPYRIHETPVFKRVRTRRTRRTRAVGKKHAGTQKLSYTRSIFLFMLILFIIEIFNPADVRTVRALRRWFLCGFERSRLASGECAFSTARPIARSDGSRARATARMADVAPLPACGSQRSKSPVAGK